MIPTADHSADHADYLRGVAMVALAGICWSISGLVVRLMADANEWQILLYRSLTLCVTLLLFIRMRSPVMVAFRAAGGGAMLAGLCLGCAYACWIFAMTHTTIANAMFVLAAAPFMTAALARLIIGERVRRITLVCMGIALVGVLVMLLEGFFIGRLSGNLFALGAALGFSMFTVLLRRTHTVDMTPAVFWSGICGALLGAAAIAFADGAFTISRHDLQLCALLGCVQVGLGLILYTLGAKHVPAAELALLSLTEIILGPVWVWLWIGEAPSLHTMIGGVVVLSAVLLQATMGIRRRPPPLIC